MSLDKAVFQRVNMELPAIRTLVKERRLKEAYKRMNKINEWLQVYNYKVVEDSKYLVSIKPMTAFDTPICECGAVKQKEYATCYDCYLENKPKSFAGWDSEDVL